jgi:peptide/nickel transport system ATP-binding protein
VEGGTAEGGTVRPLDGAGLDLAEGSPVQPRPRRGRALGLVGESGCGKAMTALSVLGLLPAGARITSGSVRFDGADLARASERELREVRGNTVGMVFQDPMSSLNPTATIGAQVAEPLPRHRDIGRSEAGQRAVEAQRLLGLPQPGERMKNYPHRLSAGMRQRVAIAMALVRARLMIADEPVSALDVSVQAQILDLMRELPREKGLAYLFISHDPAVVRYIADRVGVMYLAKWLRPVPWKRCSPGRCTPPRAGSSRPPAGCRGERPAPVRRACAASRRPPRRRPRAAGSVRAVRTSGTCASGSRPRPWSPSSPVTRSPITFRRSRTYGRTRPRAEPRRGAP